MKKKMLSLYIYIILLEILNPHCKSHQSHTQEKFIKVAFVIDDSSTNLDNNYRVSFVKNIDTLNVTTKNDSIFLPELKDSVYDLLFKYDKYILLFKDIKRTMLVPTQNIIWKFGIKNKPFSLESGLLSVEDFKTDSSTVQLVYLQFLPQEFGDGIQIVQKKAKGQER